MKGKIEIITGCMFAGKSTELLKRLKLSKEKFLLVKPKIDIRHDKKKVITHSGENLPAIVVDSVSEINSKLKEVKLLGIDEAQFFTTKIVEDCKYIKKKGVRIIIAGLHKDYLDNKFNSVDALIKEADVITKLYATCNQCGDLAMYSHRITHQKSKILLGDQNHYEPLCKMCYKKIIDVR